MNWMVLSCKRATLLLEQSRHQPLSLLGRMQLSIHLKLCENCTRYEKQSLFVETTIKANLNSLLTLSGYKLSDRAKSGIQKEIDNYLNKM